jgi:hypothetical protein
MANYLKIGLPALLNFNAAKNVREIRAELEQYLHFFANLFLGWEM